MKFSFVMLMCLGGSLPLSASAAGSAATPQCEVVEALLSAGEIGLETFVLRTLGKPEIDFGGCSWARSIPERSPARSIATEWITKIEIAEPDAALDVLWVSHDGQEYSRSFKLYRNQGQWQVEGSSAVR